MWQSDRAAEKEKRLLNINELSKTVALSLTDIQKLPLEEVNDYPIKLKGSFEKDVLFLLDNQTNEGRLGYRVYQVFNVAEQSVLINLGWVIGSINRAEIPDIKPILGPFEINGHIRLMDKGIMLMEQHFNNVSWPLRVQQIELDKFSDVINKKLVPFVVYVNEDEALGYKKNWQPIVMPPEKHRAYAFQWFSLAVAWLILMCWALIKFNDSQGQVGLGSDKTNNKRKGIDV